MLHRSIRINEDNLMALAARAQTESTLAGYLHKRSSDGSKWHQRWFILYQNLMFYYLKPQTGRLLGVILLEGCYSVRTSEVPHEEHAECSFIITFANDIRTYEFRAETVDECKRWTNAISAASYENIKMQKEELSQKNKHIMQIVQSERTSRAQYVQQCKELSVEVNKLKVEVAHVVRRVRNFQPSSDRAIYLPKVCSQNRCANACWINRWLCRRSSRRIMPYPWCASRVPRAGRPLDWPRTPPHRPHHVPNSRNAAQRPLPYSASAPSNPLYAAPSAPPPPPPPPPPPTPTTPPPFPPNCASRFDRMMAALLLYMMRLCFILALSVILYVFVLLVSYLGLRNH